ncbi:bifunctional polynucleotide phosphatase/kinase [Holotrichia oblita]|uniref:Bifunctional polynucleotide phosphatase/kinase n=1 Tax=Holotrichia oblita TaxID=644536 RepID=A0ACB9SNK3_HOLOL|nr:bifunctional polynucleotide phosphatase/kinase [Holotrichia oblita]
MTSITNCYVQPIGNGYKRVTLPHQQTVYLGRNPKTCIQDTAVSKNQLSLKADYRRKVVECVWQGINQSGYNGYTMKKDTTYGFSHGDKIEVVLGKFMYEVVFESQDLNTNSPNKKLKLSNASSSVEESTVIPNHFNGSWQFIDNSLLIYTPDVDVKGNKIASFDLDGTLIKTKSGKRFPVDKNDWVFTFPNVQDKLKELYLDGYKIVIFSNQLRLGQEKQSIPSFKEKIVNIIRKIGVPIQAFLATQRDIYRKPLPGMWNCLLKLLTDEVNMDATFYIGDAAGREKNWAPSKSKDHSVADRLFTINTGVKFHTPEEYFLRARSVKHVMPEFDPRTIIPFPEIVPVSPNPEAIIMVGSQGSGKSYFCNQHLVSLGYVYINRDTLGTKQKCLNLFEDCLRKQKAVVVDNTNPDIESRKPYIDLCKKYNFACKCFHMNVSHAHSQVLKVNKERYESNFLREEDTRDYSGYVYTFPDVRDEYDFTFQQIAAKLEFSERYGRGLFRFKINLEEYNKQNYK